MLTNRRFNFEKIQVSPQRYGRRLRLCKTNRSNVLRLVGGRFYPYLLHEHRSRESSIDVGLHFFKNHQFSNDFDL